MIYIDDTPPGIEHGLLRDVFITTQEICLEFCGDEVYGALCDALVHPLCMIETLLLISADGREQIPPSVYITNTSLRGVGLFGSAVPNAMTGSRTIDQFYLQTKTRFPDTVWRDIYLMPALRSIKIAAPQPFPPPGVQAGWPQCVVDKVGDYTDRVRLGNGVLSLRHRQRMRALYECAGRVLPDHVISEIAAELIIPAQCFPWIYVV
jgi:hypothetical protein